MMKMIYDYDMTDRTGMVYVEIKTELPWPIGYGMVYDED